MVTLDLSRVDRKAQGPLELESYLFPFGHISSHILKPNWNDPKCNNQLWEEHTEFYMRMKLCIYEYKPLSYSFIWNWLRDHTFWA